MIFWYLRRKYIKKSPLYNNVNAINESVRMFDGTLSSTSGQMIGAIVLFFIIFVLISTLEETDISGLSDYPTIVTILVFLDFLLLILFLLKQKLYYTILYYINDVLSILLVIAIVGMWTKNLDILLILALFEILNISILFLDSSADKRLNRSIEFPIIGELYKKYMGIAFLIGIIIYFALGNRLDWLFKNTTFILVFGLSMLAVIIRDISWRSIIVKKFGLSTDFNLFYGKKKKSK